MRRFPIRAVFVMLLSVAILLTTRLGVVPAHAQLSLPNLLSWFPPV